VSNIRLGDICVIRKGTKNEMVEQNAEAIRYIQIDDLRNGDNIKHCKVNKKCVLADINDIIIVWDGANAGTIGYGLKGAIGSTLAIIRLNSNNFVSRYVGKLLHGKFTHLRNNCTGATIPHINRKSLEDIEIPLYSIAIQSKIAKTLDTASELLAMRKQQLAELDNLIKSTFYNMFGNPTTNEKRWDTKKIVEMTNVETGSTPSRNNTKFYDEGSVPWVKTGEISDGYIYSSVEKITESAIDKTNCKLFPKDSILVAMYGQGKTRGQVGILKIQASTNQACAAILPNDNYVSEFLYRLLQIRYLDLRELGRGGNQPNLNLTIVKNFEVLNPPLLIQNQFATIVTKIEEQKAHVKKAIDDTQYLLDSLMAQYFE
jgi:type I restriction enzyme S subunit